SKFQTSPSPVPLPEKLPACPALRLVGALVIVLVGSVTVTGTVCEVIRPPVQAENGWKALAGMVVPFRVTARLFGSKVQLASTATLTVPLVPTAPSLGVGPMKRSGLGFGSPHAAGGCARIAPRATPRGTAFLDQLIARPSPPCGESPFSASFDLSQTLAPVVNGVVSWPETPKGAALGRGRYGGTWTDCRPRLAERGVPPRRTGIRGGLPLSVLFTFGDTIAIATSRGNSSPRQHRDLKLDELRPA